MLGEKALVLAVVIIALFGYRRLPDAARAVGRSMRILRAETRGLRDDGAGRADLQEKAEAQYVRDPHVQDPTDAQRPPESQ